MSLFFDLLSSINNPNQQGNVSQLESVMDTIQRTTANQGIESSKVQDIMAALGPAIAPVLLRQQGSMGGQMGAMLSQLTGNGSAAALQSMFPPQLQQQVAQSIGQKTGVNANTVMNMLPMLIPAVMGLLNMGAPKPGTTANNSLLEGFLKSSADNDLGTVFKFANRFLNPPKY